jgi:hypothetical protein
VNAFGRIRTVTEPRRLRPDDVFFPAIALLLLGIVVTGFAQSYFFAGMIRAKLPNTLVHIHGALFVSWIFLLIVQTMLVAVRKVRWHVTLGILGVILPPLMLILGILTLFDSIRRGQLGIPPEFLLVGDIEQLILFIVIISWAMLARRNAASHKRLMILGTMAILGPAIDRWELGLPVTIGVSLALPLLIVGYDLCLLRRVHRSTVIAYLMIAAMILTLLPVASLPVWQRSIYWIRHT